jgi:hypothetical protein
MHSQRSILRDLFYGSDGQNLFFRVDFAEPIISNGAVVDFQVTLRAPNGRSYEIRASADQPGACDLLSDLPKTAVDIAVAEIFEARVSMSALQVKLGEPIYFRLTVLRDGLPVATIPGMGELELHSGDLAAYAY